MSKFDRRTMMRAGAALIAAPAVLKAAAAQAQGAVPAANPVPEVRAMLFDVFGTVVDWRNGVAGEAERILKPLGYSLDWLNFADQWRAQYQPGMQPIRDGREPFARLDVIHGRMLDLIKPRSASTRSMKQRRRN